MFNTKFTHSALFLVGALRVASALQQPADAVRKPPEDDPNPAAHSLTALLDGSGFVSVPAGEFLMGSTAGNDDEQPTHRVRISQGFEISKFEVTQAQWDAVVRSAHDRPGTKESAALNPSHFKGPSRPVESANYEQVQQFLTKLNARDSTHTYRLPTEAEWEYAAKAGRAEGAKEAELIAWNETTSGGETHVVGQKPPNPWGLYDIDGNVREWVQDWYAPDYYSRGPRNDPQGPASSSYKVYRGGAWLSSPEHCRLSFRGFNFPNSSDYSVGFRLVRVPR